MWRWSLLGLVLTSLPAIPAEHKHRTVSLERLWGFERHIQAAAEEIEFPYPLLPPGAGELRIYLSPKFASAGAQRSYYKMTGRNENSTLELYDSRAKKSPVAHSFHWGNDDKANRRVARDFLLRIKGYVATP